MSQQLENAMCKASHGSAGMASEAENVEQHNDWHAFKGRRICLLAPYPPRKGGVTVQTDLLARALEREGAELIKVDTNLQKLRFPVLGTPIRLAVQPWVVAFRLMRALPKCEVVHIQAAANWGYMPAVIGVPLARLFRKRSVMSFQSGIGPIFMDRFGWLVKMPFRKASVSTVCSQELRDAFKERGVDTTVLPNLFESELFAYRERSTIEPKIIWTRSFEELYDPLSAVRTFEILRRRYPNATMVMTSNGPLMPAVRSYIKSHELSGITLTGRVPKEEVARLMNEAGVCINTTRHDGLPTAMLEAAGSGLPIVTTNVGGIASLFRNGVSAIMVEPGDHEAMAEAIISLLDHPDKAAEIGKAARDSVTDYTWDHASKLLAEAYGFAKSATRKAASN